MVYAKEKYSFDFTGLVHRSIFSRVDTLLTHILLMINAFKMLMTYYKHKFATFSIEYFKRFVNDVREQTVNMDTTLIEEYLAIECGDKTKNLEKIEPQLRRSGSVVYRLRFMRWIVNMVT